MAKYSIVGAGSNRANPIDVFVECSGTTAIACWTGRISITANCNTEMYRDERYCQEVTFPIQSSSYIGKFEWRPDDITTIDVWYRVNWKECPTNPPGCVAGCTNLTAYAVPGSVESGYSGNIEIHYDYLLKCYGNKTGIATVPFTSFSQYGESYKYTYITSDQCITDVIVHKKSDDECKEGCIADVSISFSHNVVPASGKTIQVIVSFKKTVIDDDCKKKVTTGSFSLPWDISECIKTDENDKHCCSDHYVESAITIANVKSLGKLEDCEIRYNGKQSNDLLYYKVLQKAKRTDECSGTCEGRTTYCVDQSSVKVCYETKYLSDKWICEGESYSDCDCAALSINGVNGAYSVPFTGGRIKVKWNYSAHTITDNCTEYDTTGGTWEEIITIGGCDERPIDCKDEYKYDDETYSGCKTCDAECCYDYDGNGTCKCVILFKEQTPGCTTCDNYTLWDDEEQRQITYNKIRYEFVQDCTNICDYTRNTQFEKKTVNVDKCFTGDVNETIPFTSVTEYHGAGCPAPEEDSGTVPVTVNVPTKNNTGRERIVYEDDMIKVVQDKGPCDAPVADCDCYALSIEGQEPGPSINCTCRLSGVYNNSSRGYSSEGSSGEKIKIGTYTLGSECGTSLQFDKIVAGSNNQATSYRIWNSTSDFEFSNGDILAKVPKNSGKMIHIHCHFKCKTASTASDTDYINFYQDAGGDTPSTDCEPNENSSVNSSLDSCIYTVTYGTELAGKISIDNTKCTYYYLQKGFEYLGNEEKDTKLWFLANMLSELTPDGDLMDRYFINAASSGGQRAPLFKNDTSTTANPLYELRIKGGVKYAQFKGSYDYAEGNKDADRARKELYNNGSGVRKAVMKPYTTEQPTSTEKAACLVFFSRDSSEIASPKDVLPTSYPTNDKEKSDWMITQEYISSKPTVDGLSPDYQALHDKNYSSEYICTSVNGVSAEQYSDYTFFATDIVDALTNRTKTYYKRPRPGQQYTLNGASYFSDIPVSNFVFLCDCGIEADPPRGKEGVDCTYCRNEYDGVYQNETSNRNSFPSGHASKAFMSYLALCEVGKGNYSRTLEYCENRAVVRAHWRSDTLAAKYVASMGIGILNGYKSWQVYRKTVLFGDGNLKYGDGSLTAAKNYVNNANIFTDTF